MTTAEFLEGLAKEYGDKTVIKWITESFRRAHRQHPVFGSLSEKAFQDARGATHAYRNGKDRKDWRLLAMAARLIPFNLEPTSLWSRLGAPWDKWDPSSPKVYVVVGGRPGDRAGRYGVDICDVLAYIRVRECFQKMEIYSDVHLHVIPHTMNPADAEKEFTRILNIPGIGAIICLGSWVACPISDVVAGEILDDVDKCDLPACIQWGYKRKHMELLSADGVFTGSDVGIRECTVNHVYRRSDTEDAGILLVDARRRRLGRMKKPHPVVLAACIGHAGGGTIAAAAALTHLERVSAHLADAPLTYGDRKPRMDRVFELVKVTDKVGEDVDDSSWDYVWEH